MTDTTLSERGARSSGGLSAVGSYIRTAIASRWIPPVAVFVFVFGAWELASILGVLNEILVPPPSAILTAFSGLLTESFFWTSVRITSGETLAGLVLGGGVGFLIGVASGVSHLFHRAIYPYILSIQTLPRVALAPIVVTWFGFGFMSKAIIAALLAFFPVLINTMVGMSSADNDARLLMRSLGASHSQMLRNLTLPTAAPFIFAGVKTAMTLALIGAIVGEFVGASLGLGVLLKQFNFQFDVDRGFAVLLSLSLIGLLLYGLISYLDKKFIYWE